MYKTRITGLMMLLLVTSCSSQTTTNPEPVALTDSSCSLFSPIITHGDDARVLDIRTIRAINAHNDLWDSLCHAPAAK